MKCMKREQQPDRPNEATRHIPCCQTPLPLASKPDTSALPHSGDVGWAVWRPEKVKATGLGPLRPCMSQLATLGSPATFQVIRLDCLCAPLLHLLVTLLRRNSSLRRCFLVRR